MFDTHCHLNFSAFKKNLDDVIENAKTSGVHYFVIPGTDYVSSKRAVEIAEKNEGFYTAVGIHPHHVFEIKERCSKERFCKPLPVVVRKELEKLKSLISSEKVVAIGEIGIDRHIYQKTKYNGYSIDEALIEYQKAFLEAQLDLAMQYEKSVILHNREAKEDILKILADVWSKKLEDRTVFHCCEPDQELLDFAKDHKIYLGVDGDVTYSESKKAFIKKIPLELLVLETDSPFLLPEPLRSQKKYPNEPKNLAVIAEYIAHLKNVSINQLIDITTENGKKLFNVLS
ncbi:TatD family hydrolase [Candidatus Roizmanbacteria bacterium]|nr:TatD family hydrolase [Candidatus Roizmanbacteria bacterium]